ncbi:hypothetical protein C0993_002911, partial [Termitomyces sp. T159_Od127]
PLPDDYFDPTTADLKAAQSTLAARTQALVNAPLELRSVREAREQAKRDRWPNVNQSPPKRDLKVSDPRVRDLSLVQLQLAPSSVLLLRFEDDSLNGLYIMSILSILALIYKN